MNAFGNLHPLLHMNPKEVRKATGIFEMLDEHLARPLMELSSNVGINTISKAYDDFVATSNQLSGKLQEIAASVLEREIGLRPGMIIKVTSDGISSHALNIVSLRLSHSTPLSSSPNQWEWRVFGTMVDQSRGGSAEQMTTDCSLNGNVSIERQVLGGEWLLMVSPASRSAEHAQKKTSAHG